jgi:DNA replication protein DnaC
LGDYYTEIIGEFQQKRLKAKQDRDFRLEEVTKRLPEIAELNNAIAEITPKLIASITQSNENSQSLYGEFLDLKGKRDSLLLENNIPPETIQEWFSCQKCKDTGFVYIKQIREKCNCFIKREIEIKYRQSGLKEKLKKENFKTFNFDYYTDILFPEEGLSPLKNMEKIYKYCMEYSKDFDIMGHNFLFYGNPGLGKTFLSNCIAKELLEKNISVIYKTYNDLLYLIKSNMFSDSKVNIDDLLSVDFLIIDDLGAENTTDFAVEQLFYIINSRLLNAKKFLISTNLNLEALSNVYSKRLFSRIVGTSKIFKFFGDDIRIMKKI